MSNATSRRRLGPTNGSQHIKRAYRVGILCGFREDPPLKLLYLNPCDNVPDNEDFSHSHTKFYASVKQIFLAVHGCPFLMFLC